jgi:hypothetical protein
MITPFNPSITSINNALGHPNSLLSSNTKEQLPNIHAGGTQHVVEHVAFSTYSATCWFPNTFPYPFSLPIFPTHFPYPFSLPIFPTHFPYPFSLPIFPTHFPYQYSHRLLNRGDIHDDTPCPLPIPFPTTNMH